MKKLYNQDLETVSGGRNNLEDYLITLAGKHKNDKLVDCKDGSKLGLDPSVQCESDDGNLHILKREKQADEMAELIITNNIK